MEIKSFESANFAGLKDLKIEFEPGLNVVLGPNESGKSSLVEGIFATLFMDPKIKQNTKAGKEFYFRYMPRPRGDFIDGKLNLRTPEGDFVLSKEWGTEEKVEFIGSDGSRIRRAEDVKAALSDLLKYGESTYENVVFAKQRNVKEALDRIVSDGELTKEIKDVLHMALMELSGISVDEIERKLKIELDRLYSRWDIDKNYPENNRGISNPYVNNLGTVIESFYLKEKLRVSMEKAERAEQEFEQLSGSFRVLEEEYNKSEAEKKSLGAIEESVKNRVIIGLKIEGIEAEEKALYEVNEAWPKMEFSLEEDEKKLKALMDKKVELQRKQEVLKMVLKAEEVKGKLDKLAALEEKKKAKSIELSALAKVEQIHVDTIDELNHKILKLDASLKGRDMQASIKSTGDKAIFVTKDLAEREHFVKGDEIKAGGYLKIEYGDELAIEVKASSLDFERIKTEYEGSKEKLHALLVELKLKSEKEARSILDKRREIDHEIELLTKEEKLIMGGKTYEELKKTLHEYGSVQIQESSEDLDGAERKMAEEEVDLKSNIKALKDKIGNWTEKYDSRSKLVALLARKLNEKEQEQEKLGELAPLPSEFKSPDEFQARLKEIREGSAAKYSLLNKLREDFYEAKSNLPEESFEDYRQRYIQAEEEFEWNLHRGEKLKLIEKVFYETKEMMNKNPMEPLAKEFTKLLSRLTLGNFKKGEMDENFNMRLEKLGGEIPLELLSAGTYDAVALALRLALMRHFFEDGNTFMVMDDCLVDLDPDRKEAAAKMIRDFGENYQIIFTTCHPETARLLGGNLINLQ